MEERSTSEIYKQWKSVIKEEEEMDDNRPASIALYRCRTNPALNNRNRCNNGDISCDMYGAEQ